MSRGGNRSHPPSLLHIVERTLREECSLAAGDCLLLAVSGGSDSTAMLHVMARLAPKFGIGLFAHGVDHGLRAEAGRELALAAKLAGELGVAFSSCQIALAHGGNLQARARYARYAALQQRASEVGARIIATAHHADDRAETVLLRLMRGSGLLGLGVLGPREPTRLRPMIRAHKADILAHLRRHDLPYASDPSNDNTRYLRVKVRKEILPILVAASPGVVQHLCALADQALEAKSRDSCDSDAMRLGRRQRVALARAIELGQVGFELPLANDLILSLDRQRR